MMTRAVINQVSKIDPVKMLQFSWSILIGQQFFVTSKAGGHVEKTITLKRRLKMKMMKGSETSKLLR
jgi:hypothetical protein